MAIKKRPLHKSEGHIVTNKNNKERVLEKIVLALFLVFVIIAMIVLFKAPTPTQTQLLTGKTIASIALDKTQYNASEKLSGSVSLQLEEGDRLPPTTKIDIFVSSNLPNCSLNYICPDNVNIPWHQYDSTTGQCIAVDPDPESTCCLRMAATGKCSQVILNSKFNAPLTPINWRPVGYGIDPGVVYVEPQVVNSTGETILENALALDSSSASTESANISVKQLLAERAFKVKDLVQPSQSINLTADNVKVKIGTLINNPQWVDGKYGKALQFNGINTYVNVGNDSSLNLVNAVTMEAWIYPIGNINASYGMVVGKGCDKSYEIYTYDNQNKLAANVGASNGFSEAVANITKGKWQHIVGTYQKDIGFKLYINGTLAANASDKGSINTTIENLFIGGAFSGCENQAFNGTIDEVRIYKKALSADEVSQRYQGQDTPNIRNSLVAEFKFDEGQGTQTVWGGSNSSIFNATMIVDGVDVTNNAQFTWTQNPVKGIITRVGNGKTITFIPTVLGETLITVTGDYNGRTASASRRICIYVNTPRECLYAQQPVEYSTNNENEIKSELHLQSNEPRSKLPELYLQGGQANRQLKWKVALSPDYSYYGTGCAFEVIVKGVTTNNQERALHYWYSLSSSCPKPADNNNNKYIQRTAPSADYVLEDSDDIYTTWRGKFGVGSIEDTITEIWLVSHGKFDGYNVWSQKVYFDNVELRKYSETPEPSLQCTARGKKCCGKGAGLGNFYEQLTCAEDKECWDSCAPSFTLNLSGAVSFISLSNTPQKWNRTDGICQAIVQGNIINLYDSCWNPNSGYGACLDTSNSSCNTALCKCQNWNNIYEVNLSKPFFNQPNPNNQLKAPAQNGTYALNMRISYKPIGYEEEILIYETSAPFTVGVPGIQPQCPDEQNYDCTNAPVLQDWTSCVNNQQSRILNCSYNGTNTALCAPYKAVPETRSCVSIQPCTESDYSCDTWQPDLCSPGSTQTRDCKLTSTTCSPNVTGSTAPITERTCDRNVIIEYVQAQYSQGITRSQVQRALQQAGWSQSEIESILNHVYGVEEKPVIAGWIIWIIIGVVVIIAILVLLKFAMPKKGAAKAKPGAEVKGEAYPELTSYIKDALAAGATKQEIVTKLQEAGWPKDAIEASFKSV